jgi:hypothetical protein
MIAGLPHLPRGRPNGAAKAAYQTALTEFCDRILQIRSRLDFEVGTRGWCYLLEGERVIDKGEFDTCEQLITYCRKDGNLPLDICAEDGKRAVEGLEDLDEPNVETRADDIFRYIHNAHSYYEPISFWDDLDVYVETRNREIGPEVAVLPRHTVVSRPDPKRRRLGRSQRPRRHDAAL